MAPTLRSLLACAAGVATAFRGAAAAAAAAGREDDAAAAGVCGAATSGREGASCRAAVPPPPAGEQLLLQVVHRTASNASAPGDFGGVACPGMPDVKRTCSPNGCKVLAKTAGRSCTDYCRASGRACAGAWEEVSDDCNVKFPWTCDQPLDGTSDLLCECDPEGTAPPAGPSLGGADGLRLVWSDEFEGGAVDASRWGFVTGGGGFGNQEQQHYTRENAVVQDGVLRIVARCQDYGREHFTSSKLTTEHLADWGPGHRVDVRARLPHGKGTWPAIWMLPTDSVYGRWPASGEIDIMEAVGCTRDKVYGTVHTGRYNHMKNTEKYNSLRTPVGEWHTYSIVWEEHELRWYVDGTQYHVFHPSSFDSQRWPFSQRFYLILNLAVGGSWGGYCLHGRPSCHSPDEFGQEQVMEVDYARVYELR